SSLDWSSDVCSSDLITSYGFGGPMALADGPSGQLVAGGVFHVEPSGGGEPFGNIARWDGAAWLPLGEGVDGYVFALLPRPDNSLVVGGWFDTAGGETAHGLARWDGEEWHGVPGPSPATMTYALAALPNGDIAVGGQIGFSDAHLAIWGCRCYADCDADGSLDFFDFLCF